MDAVRDSDRDIGRVTDIQTQIHTHKILEVFVWEEGEEKVQQHMHTKGAHEA